MLKRAFARLLARLLPPSIMTARENFDLWQERGFHVTPVHFYEPLPDTRTLDDQLWQPRRELPGIDLRAAEQLRLLAELARLYKSEYDQLAVHPTAAAHEYYIDNPHFRNIDAEFYYALIRHSRPRRIYEIGSGFSTRLAAQALLKNREQGAHECELVAFEPYPPEILRAGFPGFTRLVEQPVQRVALETFQALGENDVLFIDSSHVLKTGSDVQYVFLRLLPRLRPGVLIHFHDIFIPAEYPREWILHRGRFWNEQYILEAFLSFNSAFEIVWAAHYLHLEHPREMARAFQYYLPDQDAPGSFWIRKIK